MTRQPPGPRNGLLTLLGYLRDPYGTTMRDCQRHGDRCTIATWPTGKTFSM